MNARIPRGFKDILPAEAALRESICNKVQQVFSLWGYQPVETPTLEVMEVLQTAGYSGKAAFRLFDSDGELLVMRPDVTLPIARLVGTRIGVPAAGEALRLRYKQSVFREERAYEAQARAVTQLGVECIGLAGLAGDVEALLLLAESLDATGLKTDRHDISSQGSYTIALCTVGVLQAILAACVSAGFTDLNWQWAVLAAWHRSDLVAVDALMDKPSIDQQYGSAISTLARLQGGLEAIDSCRALLPTQQAATADSSNGPALSADLARCSEELDRLEQTFRLVQELRPDVGWLVDFSLMGSFDYYTGLMFSAFAPGSGYPLAGGGRYDQTLSQFGAPAPATGFALNLERIVSAILSEGAAVSQSTTGSAPRRIVADPQDPARAFREANEFRTRGQVAAITEEEA